MSNWITKIRNFIGIGSPELPDYPEVVLEPEVEAPAVLTTTNAKPITINSDLQENGNLTVVGTTTTINSDNATPTIHTPAATPSPKKTKSPKRTPSPKSKYRHK